MNPLSGFNCYQMLALRILLQACRDAELAAKGQLSLDLLDITDEAELLLWLATPWAVMLWDLAQLPWHDSVVERCRFLQAGRRWAVEI